MLQFLANTLDQLALALDHVINQDVNNARFGLMLTDNAVELTLHQIAIDKAQKIKSSARIRERYSHTSALARALEQHFTAKVNFAKIEGYLSGETAESIALLHGFRNEVYHIGIQHEPILPTLASFYFSLACDFLAAYEPPFLGWSSNFKLPERAKKFFSNDEISSGSMEQYRSACLTLRNAVGHDPLLVPDVLADHMIEIVEEQDSCIDLVATGGPNKTSRDKAVIDTQAWKLALSEEGKLYARDHEWPGGTFLEYVEWIGANYPWRTMRDPIAAWRKRVQSVRDETNPHKALKKYRCFIDQTAEIREDMYEAALQIETYIEEQIERMRVERRWAKRA